MDGEFVVECVIKEVGFDFSGEGDAERLHTGCNEAFNEVVDGNVGVGAYEDRLRDFEMCL